MTGLSSWDWFVLLLVVLSTGMGLLRGMVRSVFGLGAWVVAFLGAGPAGDVLAGGNWLAGAGPWNYAIAFVALYLSMRLLGGLVSGGLKRVGLGGLDRGMGAVLGLARAVLLVALGAMLGHLAGLDRGEAWQQARSRPVLDALVERMRPLLPSLPVDTDPEGRPTGHRVRV